jgi:hypothetical protein
MSTKLDLSRKPDDFEAFGRIVWEQLNTVCLSSGNPVAATHIAIQSAFIRSKSAAGSDVALSAKDEDAVESIAAAYAAQFGLDPR